MILHNRVWESSSTPDFFCTCYQELIIEYYGILPSIRIEYARKKYTALISSRVDSTVPGRFFPYQEKSHPVLCRSSEVRQISFGWRADAAQSDVSSK